jgi:hypothetical protein
MHRAGQLFNFPRVGEKNVRAQIKKERTVDYHPKDELIIKKYEIESGG